MNNNSSYPTTKRELIEHADWPVPEIMRREWNFSQVYRRHEFAPPPLREAACLQAQAIGTLGDLRATDLLAGRQCLTWIGLGSEDSGYGYFCREGRLEQLLAAADTPAAERYYARQLLDYWRERSTYRQCRAAFPPRVLAAFPEPANDAWFDKSAVAFVLYRLAGIHLDYDKLLRLGLSGLRGEVVAGRERAAAAKQPVDFYDGLLAVIKVIQDAIHYYRDQALTLAKGGVDAKQRENLTALADTLHVVAEEPPRTFRQAAQLFWIYTTVANTRNYGRMDVYLGDFYTADLRAGRMTAEQGLELLVALWQLMGETDDRANNRVIIGGMGRRNPENADIFALAALETTRRVRRILPNLSLRFYQGQSPALYQKALDVIGEGNTHPILYNDDVNVPAVEKAFQVPRALAEQYLPFGCGEYVLDHHSIGTPNGTLNLTKVLDLALHNGMNSQSGRREGPESGEFRDCKTFDELARAYASQVDWYLERLAEAQGIIYRETGWEVCFLAISLLFDHCVQRGLPLLAGGAAHLGGTMETFGNITTADSLTAIKKLVYEQRRFTPDELLRMLDADFAGYEDERLLLKSLPKFGNDDAEADDMAGFVHDQVCHGIRSRAKLGGMDSYLVVVINNSANTLFGRNTPASADGRKAGQPLSNANQPTAGNDRRGIACLLSSMAKLDPTIHAGAVHNVKCSPDMFTKHRKVLEGALATYWQRGGTQLMFTVVNRGILEDALRHPGQYPHLMVRVGGFSAYFVKLEPDVQRDILNRTLH
ncbi:MAG: hypothetical protein LBK76_09400 [Verrucomicrobiales bacterium]|jgi:pyruvate-formate lyase|nr:hypothetical protein [Verrucomicrobiales bacterium]